jgi:ATP-dependent protease ClpP protease subunit
MVASKRARLNLYGEFGPSAFGMIDARSVNEAIQSVGEADVIDVHINSRGGSAFEGLGVASILRDHPARVEVTIDGVAASAASLIAMVGDKVTIPANGLLMLHEASVIVQGRQKELAAAVSMLAAVNTAAISLYMAKSGKSESEVRTILAGETWYTGQQAVDAGFADTTGPKLPKGKAPNMQTEARLVSELLSSPTLASSWLPTETPTSPEPKVTQSMQVSTPSPAPAVDLSAPEAKAAYDNALAAERQRTKAVCQLCDDAGMGHLAERFIAGGETPEQVAAALKTATPGYVATAASAYANEYFGNPHLAKLGLSLEDYAATKTLQRQPPQIVTTTTTAAPAVKAATNPAAWLASGLPAASVASEPQSEADRIAANVDRYRGEFNANPALAERMKLSEFIHSRMIDDGLIGLMHNDSKLMRQQSASQQIEHDRAVKAQAAANTANARFTAEYAGNPYFATQGVTLSDYVATRRIDEGLDTLAVGSNASVQSQSPLIGTVVGADGTRKPLDFSIGSNKF